MGRVARILAVWAAALVVAATLALARLGPRVDHQGREAYSHRAFVAAGFDPWSPAEAALRETVVWLGDSTVVALPIPSYPQEMAPALERRGIRSRVVAGLGLDFYPFYLLTPAVLGRLRPDVLVLVAHLRYFSAPAPVASNDPLPNRDFGDLASYLPAADIPATILLPMAERGLTVPRLLLAQAFDVPAMEQVAYWWAGGRALVRDASVWDRLGPLRSRRSAAGAELRRFRILYASNVAVTPSQPTVRMMAATVRLATRRGTSVIVVGTPLAWQQMAATIGYDPAVYAERFGVLREAVEGAGGTFLDLHEALRSRELRDPIGHFNARGAAHMARLVQPVVLATLAARTEARGLGREPAATGEVARALAR
ncbi:MAG TPA: hypothetical protein VMS22_07840 [Candidatus Eisenbacteria bacterium]|nr:hypothetical protein [Candidatus Eisenbacteria bacterium]